MRTTCIIVEDEPLARERVENFVRKIPSLALAGTFDSAEEALAFLKTNTVDLIFLDINLGGLSGIQLLEAAHLPSQVIITTAYQQFALKGFELNVTDYLLKPFTFERFTKAVERAQQNRGSAAGRAYIFVKTEYRLEKVFLDEILYIEGMRDYRRIHTEDKRIMTLQTFRAFEEQLDPSVICRVHKSFMAAIGKIEEVNRDGIRIKDKLIPVSETYRKALLERINFPKQR